MKQIHRFTKALAAAGCAICLAGAAPASAAPITWEWRGVIVSSTIPGISVYDNAWLRITYDSAVPDLDPSSMCGIYYPAILDVTAHFGHTTYASSGGGSIEVQQGDRFGCGATATSLPSLTFRQFGGSFNGGVDNALDVFAYFENGLPLASDALPLVPPELFYDNSGFRLDVFGYPSRDGIQTAYAWTQQVTLPEPTSLALFGLAGLGLIRRRRM